MTPEQLAAAIRDALQSAVDAGDLPVAVPAEVRVERPRNRDHGDWSTNIALQLAKEAAMPPRDVAAVLAQRVGTIEGVRTVDVAGPGFLNITLEAASAAELARSVVESGPAYGHNDSEADHVINIEFVSANPTGPLHLGHTRWAALGDAMARLLTASGATVTTEYYVNDAGAQMDRFAASVLARAQGQPTPEGGYPGLYVDELARHAVADDPGILDLPHDEAIAAVRDHAYRAQLAEIRDTLEAFGAQFDVFFCESELHDGGPSRAPWRGCASRATSSTTGVRCGCARPTSGTTRTGS